MSNVKQLPDLARMRTLSDRVRASSDDEVADLVTTDDGQWLFTRCAPYLDADVSRRLITVISAGIPEGAFWGLLGLTPTRM